LIFSPNSDVTGKVEAVIAVTPADWVLNDQPVSWNPAPWHRQWDRNPQLPHREVLEQLDAEVAANERIRRRFVLGYADQCTPLLIAAMAWGSGTDNRGSWKPRHALTGGSDRRREVRPAGRRSLSGVQGNVH
jgi:hypothetical protein